MREDSAIAVGGLPGDNRLKWKGLDASIGDSGELDRVRILFGLSITH